MNYWDLIIIVSSLGGVVLIFLLAFLIQGAPFVPSSDKTTKAMIKSITSLPVKRIVDLGCGDGKVVIELAAAGYLVDGIELKPWLVHRARRRIRNLGLKDKARTRIYSGNFWKFNTSEYNVVVLFAIPHIMSKLDKKLTNELRPKSYVVSNYFTFPDRKPFKSIDDVHIYKF